VEPADHVIDHGHEVQQVSCRQPENNSIGSKAGLPCTNYDA